MFYPQIKKIIQSEVRKKILIQKLRSCCNISFYNLINCNEYLHCKHGY